MSEPAYDLARYAADLRSITSEETDDRRIVQRVRPLALKLAATPGWLEDAYYDCDAAQGFGTHLLHEDADHGTAVFVIAWLSHRGTPPHNHKTWGVVAAIEGEEREVWWRRLDDGGRPGYAALERGTESLVVQASCVLPEDIHSVWNETDTVSLSLHTYGKHINRTGRSQFDPEAKTEEIFIVTVDEPPHPGSG